VRLTANFSSATYTVGAAGAGGAAGNNSGSLGGDTSFTTAGAVTYKAGGGGQGLSGGAQAPPIFAFNNPAGATATVGGDLAVPGGYATQGVGVATDKVFSGNGGGSQFGQTTSGANLYSGNSSIPGTIGNGFGSGGTGAVAAGTGSAKAGGNGAPGIIVIWEYG
jgi:hypothetical protein